MAAFCSANRHLIDIGPIITNFGEIVIEKLNVYSSTVLAEQGTFIATKYKGGAYEGTYEVSAPTDQI